jgi:predicted transcriptional regulator of viral defense system
MNFLKAITLSLGEAEEPVITENRLGIIMHRLYAQKEFKGEKIERLQKERATAVEFRQRLNELLNGGVLSEFTGFKNVYSLLGRKDEDPEDIVCSIDPFCYLSHLSAMAHHGITERIPSKLFVSSPEPKAWKKHAEERMRKELNEDFEVYQQNGMPWLTRMKIAKISRREVHRFSSSHLGAYKNVRGRVLRVSTLGRTFLDMLRNPELCGGMHHVLEVYEEHAAKYLQLIVDEIELHGTPIDKVRAGHILEERLKMTAAAIASWAKFAQRGGSRKLDASGEYEPVWSDKWCLSLNV